MSHCVPVNNGILCMCDTDFNCPICGCLHTEEDYYDQLYKSKRTFIHKKCKGCKRWLGITTDIKGDVRVWVKGTITDGFGGYWSEICATCGKKSMQVVRHGKVQCKFCG